jgi:hypothetical protein
MAGKYASLTPGNGRQAKKGTVISPLGNILF